MKIIKKIKVLFKIPLSIFYYYRGKTLLPYYPNAIWIEPTNSCNLKCIMCPNSIRKQKKYGFMDLDMFKKIVDETKEYAVYMVFSMSGEPLLHPKFPQFIAYAKKNGLKTFLSTNGTTLSKSLSKKILTAGLDWINFSFDGCTKKTYEEVRVNANFEKTLNNILNFLKLKKDLNAKTQAEIQILYMDKTGLIDYENNIDMFKSNFNNLPLNCIQLREPSTWGGFLSDSDKYKAKKLSSQYSPCSYLWESLHILWDGTVVACCTDFFADNPMGKFPQKSLKEIWNNISMQKFRKAMIKRKAQQYFSMCKNCDSIWEARVLGLPAGVRGISAISFASIFGINSLSYFKKIAKFIQPGFPMQVVKNK